MFGAGETEKVPTHGIESHHPNGQKVPVIQGRIMGIEYTYIQTAHLSNEHKYLRARPATIRIPFFMLLVVVVY